MLLELKDDKELQAALESAKKDAEEELEALNNNPNPKPKKRKPAPDKFPAHLPREDIEVAIPPAFQARIKSGELFVKHYEYTESLKTIPAQAIVLRYKRPVLAYVNDPERVLLVEGEANLGEKGRYHPSTAAHIIHSKFGLHLPLYRLQDVYATCGLTLSRSTLDYNIDLAHEVTQELTKLMLSRFLAAFCVGFDDTHTTLIMPKEVPNTDPSKTDPVTLRLIEKMKEATKEGKGSLDAKMWGYTSFDPLVPYDIFDFRVSRHRDGPAELLGRYQGYTMADCYPGNMSVILSPESKMTRMACWAHARRHVYEHQHNDKTASELPLALICNQRIKGSQIHRNSGCQFTLALRLARTAPQLFAFCFCGVLESFALLLGLIALSQRMEVGQERCVIRCIDDRIAVVVTSCLSNQSNATRVMHGD